MGIFRQRIPLPAPAPQAFPFSITPAGLLHRPADLPVPYREAPQPAGPPQTFHFSAAVAVAASFPPVLPAVFVSLAAQAVALPSAPQAFPFSLRVSVAAAYAVQPDSCVFVFVFNAPEIGAKRITDDPVTPEFQIAGNRAGWPSNTPQIATKKATT